MNTAAYIHETAEVEPGATVMPGAKVWHYAHIRKGAHIGRNTIIGRGVFVDEGVHIGNNCKVQNYACLYHGTTIQDGVFIGPRVVTTNDKNPAAVTDAGVLKTDADWQCGSVFIGERASIGTGAIILPDVVIGPGTVIGAGAVVAKSTDGGTHVGVPAKQRFIDHAL